MSTTKRKATMLSTLTGFGKSIGDMIAAATGHEDTVTVLSINGNQATISRETAHTILAARSAEAVAKAAKEKAEKALKSEIGEGTTEILVDGQVVFSWIEQRKIVLDTARLKEERPEIFVAYGKTQVTRPLLSRPKVVAALFG